MNLVCMGQEADVDDKRNSMEASTDQELISNREEGDRKVEIDQMLISNEEREESAKHLEEQIRMKGEQTSTCARNIVKEGGKGKENEEQ